MPCESWLHIPMLRPGWNAHANLQLLLGIEVARPGPSLPTCPNCQAHDQPLDLLQGQERPLWVVVSYDRCNTQLAAFAAGALCMKRRTRIRYTDSRDPDVGPVEEGGSTFGGRGGCADRVTTRRRRPTMAGSVTGLAVSTALIIFHGMQRRLHARVSGPGLVFSHDALAPVRRSTFNATHADQA